VTGIVLNAYPVAFEGRLKLWRFSAEPDTNKRDVAERLGVALWASQGDYWAITRPPSVDVEYVEIMMQPVDELRLFAARAALLDHAAAGGREAWLVKGEVRCVGLCPPLRLDAFVVDQVLAMRLVCEEYVGTQPLLLARRRARWTCTGNLSDPALRACSIGMRALRLTGDGPALGQVIGAGVNELRLRPKWGEEVSVAPADYTLIANTRLVLRLGGSAALKSLQVASGSLTRQHRKNPYAVKRRFEDVGQMITTLGHRVLLPGGDGHMDVFITPISVELEAP